MKALIVIAHGSRNSLANEELKKMVSQLSEQPENSHFDLFQAGFLELATPSIADSFDQLISQGATEFVVLPYFLNSGVHVQKDIPNAINEYRERFPEFNFTLLTHFGGAPGILSLVTELVAESHSS